MLLELPRTAGTSLAGGLVAVRMAMSLAGSVDLTCAEDALPSAKTTWMAVAFRITCRQVIMSPLAFMITPLPVEPLATGVPRLGLAVALGWALGVGPALGPALGAALGDRKSTRLNSSHANISYAVFCL